MLAKWLGIDKNVKDEIKYVNKNEIKSNEDEIKNANKNENKIKQNNKDEIKIKNEIEDDDIEDYINSDGEYECIECDFTRRYRSEFKKHLIRDKHRKIKNLPILKKKHKCNDCDIEFSSKTSLENHLKRDKHLMTEDDFKQKTINQSKKSVEVGDDSEHYVENIYKELNEFEINHVGYTGNTFDIILIDKNNIKYGVQIKTLPRRTDGNNVRYRLDLKREYDDKTLIIGLNKQDKIFVLIFFGEMTTSYIDFIPTSEKSKYTKYTYTENTFAKFKQDLIIKTKKSTVVDNITDYLSVSNTQESESLDRLNNYCKLNNYSYKRNNTNGDVIDCFINDYKIQHKSCSPEKGNYYSCPIKKGNGNGKQPYSDKDDIDFFIFEIVDKKHQNNFFIISKKKLIEKGFIKTENQKGHTTINLPGRSLWNNIKENWIIEFLNKHEQLIKL